MEEGNQYKRWTAPRKTEVVIRILRGESLDALSRELGVEVYMLEEWRFTYEGLHPHGKTLQREFVFD